MNKTYYLYENVGTGFQYLITDKKKKNAKKFGYPDREERTTLVAFVGQLTLDGYPSDQLILDVNGYCKKCWSVTEPSKAYVNLHNIRVSGPGEFETKLVDCMKCIGCGHSHT